MSSELVPSSTPMCQAQKELEPFQLPPAMFSSPPCTMLHAEVVASGSCVPTEFCPRADCREPGFTALSPFPRARL